MKSNVVKIGNPSITSEGILSGFSASNYAEIPIPFAPKSGNTWEFVTCFKLNSQKSPTPLFVTGTQYDGFAINFDSSGKLKMYISSNGSSWNLANGTTGTKVFSAGYWYWLKFAFDGSKYIVSWSGYGDTYETDITIASEAIMFSPPKITIGKDYNSKFMDGSIRLKETYFKINDRYSWYAFIDYNKKVNATVVGSPYVTNGIVGNFAAKNYIMIPKIFDVSGGKKWEMTTSIYLTSLAALQTIFITNTQYKGFALELQTSGLMAMYVSSNGTSWNLASSLKGTKVFSAGYIYWFKLSFDGSKYKFSWSANGKSFTDDIVLQSTTSMYTAPAILIGRSYSDAYFRGVLDLNETYVKVDGKTWWNCVEDDNVNFNLYALKRYKKKYYKRETRTFEQPILTADGIVGGKNFALESSYASSASYAPYKAMDGNAGTFWQIGANAAGHSLIFYNPNELNVTKLNFTFYDSAGKYGMRQGVLYASNDKTNWTQIKAFTEYSQTWDVSNNKEFYKYYKIEITQGGTYNGYVDLNNLEIIATERIETEVANPFEKVNNYDIVKNEDCYYSLRLSGGVKYYKEVMTEGDSYACYKSRFVGYYYAKLPLDVNGYVFIGPNYGLELAKSVDELSISTDKWVTLTENTASYGTTSEYWNADRYREGDLTSTTTELIPSTKDDYDIVKKEDSKSFLLCKEKI